VIYNASILRIDSNGAATPGGDPTWITGETISPPIPCCQSDPTFNQGRAIQQWGLDATDVIFVETALVPAIVAGQAMLVQLLNAASPLLWIVRKVRPSLMAGALDHLELYVRRM
jgi:hypothetical protein